MKSIRIPILLFIVLGGQIALAPPTYSRPPEEETVADEYKKALQQIEQKDFRAALSRLQAITKRDPRFYQGFNSMGVCYERLGQQEDATQAFLEALRIDPGFVDAHVNLAVNFLARGKTSEGIEEFKKAIELNPASVPALSGLGYAELQRGKPKSAVEPLEKAYALSHQDPQILIELVRGLAEAGRVSEAIRYSEAAPHVRGWNPGLDMRLGLTLLDCRQYKQAQKSLKAGAKADVGLRDQIVALSEDTFDKGNYSNALCLVEVALEFLPDSATLHSLAGACHYQLKDAPAAVAETQQAIRLDPDNEDYYLQLAQVFIESNTPDAAILLLEPALKRFPTSSRMRYVQGVAYLKSSKYAEAERYLTDSLREDPQSRLALRALADLYEGESQWEALLKLAKSMAGLPDAQPEAYYYHAEASFNLQRDQPDGLPGIEKLLETSTSLDPNFFPSYLLWGRILAAQGSYPEAVLKLERAIKLDPRSPAAHYNLALAYAKVGQTEKSAEAMNRFKMLSDDEKNRPPVKRLIYNVTEEGSGEK